MDEHPDAAVEPLSLFGLAGRVAVITGASSGIGARAARVLDALGATVVVSARRTERIEALAASLHNGHAVTCDVSETGASAALVDATVERHDRVDVVIANAGITTTVPALREPVPDFAEVVTVDLVAPYELAQAAAGHMRNAKRGGAIINVASAAAFTSTALLPQAGYVAAKTGLVGLTRELALQWARYDVRVNALCPDVPERDDRRAGRLRRVAHPLRSVRAVAAHSRTPRARWRHRLPGQPGQQLRHRSGPRG